tara:strand:+ start:801 stop:1472 length:672 start_codon:yes stop_codon:yes gene_type:complete
MRSSNILYSFRRCPFAIRARWALIETRINVVLREIDLKQKPENLILLSPKGTVPVLQTKDGQIIDESFDIILWALKHSSTKNTLSEISNIHKEEILQLRKENDYKFKHHLDRFKYSSRYKDEDDIVHKDAAIEIMYRWNNRIYKSINKGSKGWLVGQNETIGDWLVWPFVRQYLIADPDLFNKHKELNYLKKWLNYFLNKNTFQILMKKVKKWGPEEMPIYLY